MENINKNKRVLFSTVISEAMNWCEEEFKDAPKYKRRLPRTTISDLKKLKGEDRKKANKELKIGEGLSDFKRSYIYIKGKAGKVLSKEDEEIYKAYKELEKGYKINPWEATILEAKEWCKEKFNNRPIYERRMPRTNITGVRIVPEGEPETEEQRELRIGGRLANFRQRDIYINGEEGEFLSKEDERIYKLYKELENDYKINSYEATILEAREWCEEKFNNEPIYKRRLPIYVNDKIHSKKVGELETKEQRESKIGNRLNDFRKSDIYKKGEKGEFLSEEDERIYKLYKELENDYKINTFKAIILEAKEWCEENYKDKPRDERRMPRAYITGVKGAEAGELETEEQREIRIGMGLVNFRRGSMIYKKGELGEKLTAEEEIIYNDYKKIEEEYASKYQRALCGKKKQKAKAIEQRNQAKELCEQYEKLLSERDGDKIV